MPLYRLVAPNGKTYAVEGPEGASQDDVARAIMALYPESIEPPPPGPTVGGYIRESIKGVPAGAVGLLESAATGIATLLPEEQEQAARASIRDIAAAAKAPFAPRPGYEETIPRKVGEAVGSMGPFLALGPFGMAGRAGMLGLGGGAGAGEQVVRAEAEGATPEQVTKATALGAGVGLSEALPIFSILNRLGTPLANGILNRLRRVAATAGEEAAQEAAANIAQNMIAQGIYKPEQELIEGTGEAAGYGAAAGAIAQGLLDAALGRRARPTAPPAPPSSAAEEQTAQDTALAEQRAARNALYQEPLEGRTLEELQELRDLIADTPKQSRRQKAKLKEIDALISELGTTEAAPEAGAEAAPETPPTLRKKKAPAEPEAPETPVTPTEPIRFGPTDPVTPEILQAAGLPALPKNEAQTSLLNWFNQNVVGKTQEDLIKLKEEKPGLFKGKSLKARVLNELLTPETAAPVETVTQMPEAAAPAVTTPPTEVPSVQPSVTPEAVVGGTEPSVGVSGERGAVPAGEPAAPDAGGVVSPSVLTEQGDVDEGALPPAVTPTPTPEPIGYEGYAPQGREKQLEVLAGDINASDETKFNPKAKPGARLKYISFGAPNVNGPGLGGAAGEAFYDSLTLAEKLQVEENVAKLRKMALPYATRVQSELDRGTRETTKSPAPKDMTLEGVLKEVKSEEKQAAKAAEKEVKEVEKLLSESTKLEVLAADINASDATKFDPEAAPGERLKKIGFTGNQKGKRVYDSLTPAEKLQVEKTVAKLRERALLKPQKQAKREERKAKLSLKERAKRDVQEQVELEAAKERQARTAETQETPRGRKVTGSRYSQQPSAAIALTKRVQTSLEANNLSTALTRLAEDTTNPIHKRIAERLAPLLKGTKVEIRDELSTPEGVPAIGAATTDGREIYLRRDGGLNEETLLHEAIHAASERVLSMPGAKRTATQNVAVNQLNKIWEDAKKEPVPMSPEARESLSEFVAESMSNQVLQDALAAKPYQTKTLWEKFKEAILRLVGASPAQTQLDEVLAAANAIFTPQPVIEGEVDTTDAGVRYQLSPSSKAIIDSMGPAQATGVKKFIQAALPVAGGWNAQLAADLPDMATRIRTRIADRAATIEERFAAQFNYGVRDSLGRINPMLQLRQAEDAKKLLLQYYQQGILAWDPATKQYYVTSDPDTPPPAEVYALVDQWGKQNGYDFPEAKRIAGRILEGARLHALREANRQGADFRLHLKDAEIDQLYAEYQADPLLKKMQAAMDAPRLKLIDEAVKSGWLSREQGDAWKTATNYVPFDRLESMEKAFRTKKRLGRGLAQLGKIPELKGSTVRPVDNVFDNYISTMGWMLEKTVRNAAVVNTLRELEALPSPQAKRLTSPMAVRDPSRTVITLIGGQEVAYELPSSYDVLAFNNTVTPLPKLFTWLGHFSNILRTAVTAVPTFSIRQVVEDVQRAAIHSGVTDVVGVTKKALSNFAKLSSSAILGKEHPIVKEFGAIGQTGEVDWNNADPAKALLQDLGYEDRRLLGSKSLGTLLHKLNDISRASDLAVRKAIYDQTLEETNDEVLARQRAREIINFRRRGAGGKSGILDMLIQTVPFFNAYIQGMDVLYRTLVGKGAASGAARDRALKMMYTRAGIATSIGFIYALASGDDDAYKEEDLRRRDKMFMFGKDFAVPVPTELGVLFKAIPERVMEYYTRYGTAQEQLASEAFKTWAVYAFDEYFGRTVPIPQAFRPGLELLFNHSFRTGRPLKGAFQEGLDPSKQTSSTTSELAKAVSKWTSDNIGVEVSPISIDTFLNGYFGTTSLVITSTLDSVINPSRSERSLSQIVGLASFAPSPVGGRPKSEFYDLQKQTSQAVNTFNQLVKMNPDQAAAYIEKNREKLVLSKAVNDTLLEMAKIRQYIKYLETDAAAALNTPAERKQMREEAQKLEQGLVSWVREAKAMYKI